MRRKLIDNAPTPVTAAPEQPHAMKPEQIREAGSRGIETCYDCPVRRSQSVVMGENLKRLHLSFVELHGFQLPTNPQLAQVLIRVRPDESDHLLKCRAFAICGV